MLFCFLGKKRKHKYGILKGKIISRNLPVVLPNKARPLKKGFEKDI
jgi:hypothetical protein